MKNLYPSLLNTAAGIFVQFIPVLIHPDHATSAGCYIIGPLIMSFAIISIAESTRAVNKVNLILGACLVLLPLVTAFYKEPVSVLFYVLGSGVMLLAMVRTKVKNSFGGGWKSLWQ